MIDEISYLMRLSWHNVMGVFCTMTGVALRYDRARIEAPPDRLYGRLPEHFL